MEPLSLPIHIKKESCSDDSDEEDNSYDEIADSDEEATEFFGIDSSSDEGECNSTQELDEPFQHSPPLSLHQEIQPDPLLVSRSSQDEIVSPQEQKIGSDSPLESLSQSPSQILQSSEHIQDLDSGFIIPRVLMLPPSPTRGSQSTSTLDVTLPSEKKLLHSVSHVSDWVSEPFYLISNT